ncbi:MAG: signal peptide peptidase SppA [Pseudomonadota bacterium]
MPTDIDTLIDRRQMRRRLTLWRVAALVLFAVAAIAILSAAGAFSGLDKNSDQIARVPITGAITTDRELIAMLDRIAKNDSVKGVVLSINSPGGTAVGGEAIYEAVRRVAEKKPVAASVETLAASAGYMIAAASDHIVARRASIVGSIGVIIQFPKFNELLDKVGVEVREVKSSPLKAEPSPFKPSAPGTEPMLQRFIDDSYDWFVDLVAERRPFDRAAALKLADGSIYSGGQGLENGLVDALGGEREAKAWLVKKANLDEDIAMNTWKPRRPNNNPFGIRSFLRWVGEATGLSHFVPERLFLDGLLAVWHD